MTHWITREAWRTAGTAGLALLAVSAAAQGRSCESLRDEIARKFEAGGVRQPDLRVVAADAEPGGRVVGQCAQGSRRIVYVAGGTAARRAAEPVLTECRDGTVSVGGDCGHRR